MELWQMDITGGVRLADGTHPSIMTGIDDHSRLCVCAFVVAGRDRETDLRCAQSGDAHLWGARSSPDG